METTSRETLAWLGLIEYVYEVGGGSEGQGIGFPRSAPDFAFAIRNFT